MIFRVADVVRWLVDSGYGVAVTRDDVPLTIEQAARWEVDCTGLDEADEAGHDGRRGEGSRGGRSGTVRQRDRRAKLKASATDQPVTSVTDSVTLPVTCNGNPVTDSVTSVTGVTGFPVTSRDNGGGRGGLVGLQVGLCSNELKPLDQPTNQPARAGDATARYIRDGKPVTSVTDSVTSVTDSVTSVTSVPVGFSKAIILLAGDLPAPSTRTEAAWRTLAEAGAMGLEVVGGEIRMTDSIARVALSESLRLAKRQQAAQPWAWALSAYPEHYKRNRDADAKRREADNAPIPRHVIQEREAKARWDALTPEQQAAEDASRQADIDRMLKGVRRVPNGN